MGIAKKSVRATVYCNYRGALGQHEVTMRRLSPKQYEITVREKEEGGKA